MFLSVFFSTQNHHSGSRAGSGAWPGQVGVCSVSEEAWLAGGTASLDDALWQIAAQLSFLDSWPIRAQSWVKISYYKCSDSPSAPFNLAFDLNIIFSLTAMLVRLSHTMPFINRDRSNHHLFNIVAQRTIVEMIHINLLTIGCLWFSATEATTFSLFWDYKITLDMQKSSMNLVVVVVDLWHLHKNVNCLILNNKCDYWCAIKR